MQKLLGELSFSMIIHYVEILLFVLFIGWEKEYAHYNRLQGRAVIETYCTFEK